MSKTQHGICHLCGEEKPLSFEHVPPHSAFNDQPVISGTLELAMKNGPGKILPRDGTIQQRGMGQHTLCGSCNNLTGRLYVPKFAEWCRQAMAHPVTLGQSAVQIQWSNIRRLAVAKEVVAMFLSVLPDRFARSPLASFVLNRNFRGLPSDYRLFVYRHRGETFRWIPPAARIHEHKISLLSEVAFPPLGYVMTLTPEPPDQRLVEITNFCDAVFDENENLCLTLPVLETHLPLPGDYRTLAEITETGKMVQISVPAEVAKKGRE